MSQSPLGFNVSNQDAITGQQYTLNRIMGGIIIVFFIFVLFIIMFYLYLRCAFPGRYFTSVIFAGPRATTSMAPRHGSPVTTGLDKAIITQLPTFIYRIPDSTHDAHHSEASHDQEETEEKTGTQQTRCKDHVSLECAVCLSEFQDGEKGRMLPSCKHAFHIECIDMWLHSHSTCPLCRIVVMPNGGECPTPQIAMETTVPSQDDNGSTFTQASHGLGPSQYPFVIFYDNQIQIMSRSSAANKDPSCSHPPSVSCIGPFNQVSIGPSCSHPPSVNCVGPFNQVSIDIPVSQRNIVISPPSLHGEPEACSSHPMKNLALRLSFKRMLSRQSSGAHGNSNEDDPENPQKLRTLPV